MTAGLGEGVRVLKKILAEFKEIFITQQLKIITQCVNLTREL